MNPLAFDLLEDLEALCKEHDFEYAKTEDPKYFNSCQERSKKIRTLLDQLIDLGSRIDAFNIIAKYQG